MEVARCRRECCSAKRIAPFETTESGRELGQAEGAVKLASQAGLKHCGRDALALGHRRRARERPWAACEPASMP